MLLDGKQQHTSKVKSPTDFKVLLFELSAVLYCTVQNQSLEHTIWHQINVVFCSVLRLAKGAPTCWIFAHSPRTKLLMVAGPSQQQTGKNGRSNAIQPIITGLSKQEPTIIDAYNNSTNTKQNNKCRIYLPFHHLK